MDLIGYFGEMWNLAARGEVQGIAFWAALYVLVLLTYSLIRQIRTAAWPSTSGELTEGRLREFGGDEWAKSDQEYVTSALYRYSVDGREYEGHRVSPWVVVASHNAKFILEKQLRKIQMRPDGRVAVFYNPNNPARSFLIKPGLFGQIATGVLAVLPCIWYWFRFHG